MENKFTVTVCVHCSMFTPLYEFPLLSSSLPPPQGSGELNKKNDSDFWPESFLFFSLVGPPSLGPLGPPDGALVPWGPLDPLGGPQRTLVTATRAKKS